MFNAIFRPNGRGANATINPASLALVNWLAADYDTQQQHYIDLRRWLDGDHDVPLTDRQREYLGRKVNFPFSLNYLRLPVDLAVERLTITGFDGPEGIGGKGGLLDEWWTSNRMDALQAQVHYATAGDGDTSILVEWDDANGRPVFSHEPAYDGVEGMKVHYLSNQRRQITMASKVWTETTFDDAGRVQVARRLNLYMPDRIERYIFNRGEWEPFEEAGYPWPIPNPIGRVPVSPFRWRDRGGNWGESEIEQLVPLQEALNKSVLDLLEAADKTGSQLLTLSGAAWPDPAPAVEAGGVYSTPNADSHWNVIPPADLSQLREVVNDWIIRMAQIAHIPLQYFQVTGAIASAATQAADDGQLVAKIRSIATAIGNAWEDVMYIALKMNQAYTGGRALERGENIEARWAEFGRVDPMAVEERRANIVTALANAGLGVEGIVTLPALGYSQEEQAALLQTDAVTGAGQ